MKAEYYFRTLGMALQQLLNYGRTASSVKWNQCFSQFAVSMEFWAFYHPDRYLTRCAVASFSKLVSITATSSTASSD